MPTGILPALILGALTSGSMLLAQLSGKTDVPLGEGIAAFVFVSGLVWWLSHKLTRIEYDISMIKEGADRIVTLEIEIKVLREEVRALKEEIVRLNRRGGKVTRP